MDNPIYEVIKDESIVKVYYDKKEKKLTLIYDNLLTCISIEKIIYLKSKAEMVIIDETDD